VGLTVPSRAKLVQDLVNDLKAVAALRDSLIFGNSLEYLEGDRELVRTQETNLGNLVADAMLYYAKTTDSSAQISLSNGGGIRASIGVIDPVTLTKKPNEANPFASKLDGDISQLDIENALRFNNGLTLVTVTATELKEILEHGVSSVPNESGGFPQVSGLKFSFDPTQSVGSRVSSVVIVDENGDCIDTVVMNGSVDGVPSRGFRLVTNSYLAGGGDGYPFATLSSANRVDILDSISTRTGSATFTDNGREQDAFAEYLKAKFPDPSSPFKEADTPSAQDERIQDLSVRSETMCS
jgi:2',3'-cyclic-nucleotide 2'-phosphodiesterase (5'-nucleotidase family)